MWGMITERNESESDEILGKVSRGRDLVADVTDGFTRRLNVGALAASCVLEKHYVARNWAIRPEDQGITWATYRGLSLGFWGSAPSWLGSCELVEACLAPGMKLKETIL